MSAVPAFRNRSPRLPDHAFRAHVDDVRNRHPLSAVVSRYTKLKPVGREMGGLCPFHEERSASFRVSDAKGLYWCFGCQAKGDVFGFVQAKTEGSFLDAVKWLDGSDLPMADPAEMAKRRQEDEASRARDVADAVGLWNGAQAVEGTPAETYLREVRAITSPLPSSIRFGLVPAWRDDETGEWGRAFPALICAVFDRGGAVCGIQRVFLRPDGGGKARMKRPKKSLGRVRGASMRLGPVQPTIIVTEGPEDGLTLAQEIPGASVWPTLGTALMPAVEYPDEVTEIVIAGQNDPQGKVAVAAAAEALLAQGYAVRTMFPGERFKDWNDELRGVAR